MGHNFYNFLHIHTDDRHLYDEKRDDVIKYILDTEETYRYVFDEDGCSDPLHDLNDTVTDDHDGATWISVEGLRWLKNLSLVVPSVRLLFVSHRWDNENVELVLFSDGIIEKKYHIDLPDQSNSIVPMQFVIGAELYFDDYHQDINLADEVERRRKSNA